MLKSLADLATGMLRLGWRILTLRSRPEDLPATSDSAARYIGWGTYAWTFGLTLAADNLIFALLMLFAVWLTLVPARRRYGSAVATAMACLVAVFMLGFCLLLQVVESGHPLRGYILGGWFATYYVAAVRLLRQQPSTRRPREGA